MNETPVMKTVKILLLLLLCFPLTHFAQTGNYFLSHYTPAQEHFNTVCFEMTQDEKGIMYFATNSGLLEFDGKNWDILKGLSAVYTVHINPNGEIYWGGAKGFGKIGYNAFGFQQLELISDTLSTDIFQGLSIKDNIYFLSDDAIFIHSASKSETVKLDAVEGAGSFTRLFELYGAVYVNTSDQGIFKVENDKVVPSRLPLNGEVMFFSRIDDTYVLATSDNKVFVLNEDLQPREIPIQDREYADASVIISGNWVNRQMLALGTLRGGVMFINPITGQTYQIVNYSTGLPDNEVYSLMPDRNHNVWIAHDYGFTRVSPFMPFHTFSHYSGLQGNPLCAFTHNNAVYTGTSLGLFKLEKEDVYDELIYYVDVEVKVPVKSSDNISEKRATAAKTPVSEEVKTETVSKRKGVFGFLKKKNRLKEAPNESVADNEEATQAGKSTEASSSKVTQTSSYRRERRTKKVLRASQFTYKKVAGVDAKITQLVAVDGKLIASGLGGIYEVDNLQARSVHEEPVRFLFGSENILFASTYDEKVLAFENNRGWHLINSINNLDEQISFMFQGEPGELWICGLNKLFQIGFSREQVSIERSIPLENPDLEISVGVSWNDNVMIANAQGFFAFDRKTNRLNRVDSLPRPSQYFVHDQSILYRDEHGWRLAGKQNQTGNLQVLNLFHELRFISTDQQPGDLWMISRDNELYKFFGDKISPDHTAFPLFLKSVTNHDIKMGSRSKIHISEDKSAVTFEIVQPDYLSPEAVEFRYQLKGMNEKWSEWASNNNYIDFPYLPPGEYTLLVQSKNIFGKVTELDPMFFEVLPPYWKRSWFYAMEFAILASLVLLSFKLNTRYRIVSRILSLLTIILLIEFVQTMINATIPFNKESPVVDFIIQVFIALLILPVEGYLRNLMFRSLDASSKFYKFVSPGIPAKAAAVDNGIEEFHTSDKEETI